MTFPIDMDRRSFLHLAGGIGVTAAWPHAGPEILIRNHHRREDELRVGYLPITDATPLLMAHADGYYADEGLEVERPRLFRGWSQLAEAFQARQLDVVHVLMPMAVWLRSARRFPLKLVAWCHTGGSALTVASNVQSLAQLASSTCAIPYWYSIHNVILQMMLRDQGLRGLTRGEASEGETKLIVMAPPDMPTALANRSIRGYIVADPFNAVAEVNNIGSVLRLTNDVWRDHACCVVVMHEDDVNNRPEYTQRVVNALVRAQHGARNDLSRTALILSRDGQGFIPQPRDVVEWALTHHGHDHYPQSGAIKNVEWRSKRIDFQPFPFRSYTEELVRRLRETDVEGDATFLNEVNDATVHNDLVDDRFVRQAIDALGGPSAFDLPATLTRTEQIVL